jgi:hypothetical protein
MRREDVSWMIIKDEDKILINVLDWPYGSIMYMEEYFY